MPSFHQIKESDKATIVQEKDDEVSKHFTVWKNNTDKTFSFKIYGEERIIHLTPNQYRPFTEAGKRMSRMTVIIQPGKSVEIDSRYDNAIRTVNESGNIVGGLCPHLSKVGEDETPKFSLGLDSIRIEEEEERKKLIEKMEAEARYLTAVRFLEESGKKK
jgi:hypothetical protein